MKLAIKPKTEKEYKLAVAFLYSYGYQFYQQETYRDFLENESSDVMNYKYITLDTEEQYQEIDFSNYVDDGCDVFDWVRGFDKIEKILNTKPFTMKLTEDYNAEITNEGVVVGCQTIDFYTFRELVKLVDKFENR